MTSKISNHTIFINKIKNLRLLLKTAILLKIKNELYSKNKELIDD